MVPKGEKATLTVKATSYYPGEKLNYDWGVYDQDGADPSFRGDTFLTKNIDTFEYYICEVSSESCGSSLVKILVIADDLVDKLPKDQDNAVLLPTNGATQAVCINRRIAKNIACKFIPEQSGVWKISENQSNPWMDDTTDLVIYDSEMREIARGRGHNDVSLGCYMDAGKVYYIGITNGFSGYDLYTLTSQYLSDGGEIDEWHTKVMKSLPTCTENGKRNVWSDELGMYVYDFTIPALGHISNENWTVDKEANCTEDGDRYRTCSRCGEVYHEVIPKTGHKYDGDWTIEKEVTCGVDGTETRICTICGTKESKTIPATGKHSYTAWSVKKAATCTVDGVQSRSCTVCGKTEEKAISKTGHKFGSYVVTKAPTALKNGTKTRTCSVCGKKESLSVSKLKGKIRLTKTAVTLKSKGTTQLSGIVTGMAKGDYIKSYVSDNTKIAAVNSKGVVTAKAAGKANIKITLASGVTATVKMTVQPLKVATTKLQVASSVKLTVGQKKKLAVTVTPKNTTDKVTYTSANKSIATVSSNGTITAKKAGKTKITVQSGSKKATVTITVVPKEPTGIKGIPTKQTLKKGKTLALKAKLVPTGAEAKITYKSSNTKVATVDAKGNVKAKKAGTAVITVTAGKVKATCKITVK